MLPAFHSSVIGSLVESLPNWVAPRPDKINTCSSYMCRIGLRLLPAGISAMMTPTKPCDPSRWEEAAGPPQRAQCFNGPVFRSSTPYPVMTASPSLSQNSKNADLRAYLFAEAASNGIHSPKLENW